MPLHRFAPLCLILLVACAEAPSLDDRISPAAAAAPYPALMPLAPLLALAAQPGQITPQTQPRIDGNAASLRARAARLRAPVIDSATRARMQRGIDTSALR